MSKSTTTPTPSNYQVVVKTMVGENKWALKSHELFPHHHNAMIAFTQAINNFFQDNGNPMEMPPVSIVAMDIQTRQIIGSFKIK